MLVKGHTETLLLCMQKCSLNGNFAMITIVNIIDMVVWVYDLQFVLVHCAVFNIACSFLQNAVKHDIF